jgi:hypothetical protein
MSQLGYNIRILNLQIVIDRLEAFLVKNIECFYPMFCQKFQQSVSVTYTCNINIESQTRLIILG